ncbi:MAG: MmgE/PrpD family protein [Candidatus Puniceispirillaceae bacterium]|jgi:2-methylcitrate dehydratase PrpD
MNAQLSQVTDFVFSLAPENVPAAARRAAALMCLDTLGVAAAATPMQAGRIGRDTAALLHAAGAPSHAAPMLFDGRRVSLAGAAYAAATQTDNLDAHDGYNPVKGHIGVVIIPALLALAEQADDMDGDTALMLITLGYEIAGRAGLALHATACDYHTSGAWNALGVVAVAARMRGLSTDQFRQALGIAEYHGPRSQMMREIGSPSMLHDGSGWGAMVGISSAILAEKGFTGAPAITVENPEVARIWADLGGSWIMSDQYVKPYPICRWAHAPIDGVRELMLAHDLTHDDIAGIRINTFHEGVCLFQGVPDSTAVAQYSLSFAVATQAVHGRIGLEHVSGAGLRDPRVLALIDRIAVAESDVHNASFPHTRDADVQITLRDGRELDSGLVHARGGSERPMPEGDIIAKFGEFAGPVLGASRADAIRDAVLGLADGGAGLADLRQHLYAPVDS